MIDSGLSPGWSESGSSSHEAHSVAGPLKGLLASTDTRSLGPKWTGHPTALLFELRAGIPWEVATAAAATALSAWPPKHRCAAVVFSFLLSAWWHLCHTSAWWHLCHTDSVASRWEEASGVKSLRQIQPLSSRNLLSGVPHLPVLFLMPCPQG